MSVPVGYKQTEIGVIPEDWQALTFGDVLTRCTSGATPYRGKPDYYKGDIPWVSSGELDYNVIFDTREHVSERAVDEVNLRIHPPGTFLMAITGLEAAGTRGSCAVLGVEATTNQSCMALYAKPELSTDFLFHYYCFRGDELALRYCQGTKQQSYTARIVKLLPIPLPPLAEQHAIGDALSDVDALIVSLEALAEKKSRVKEGMMYALLTGSTRLPGFDGEWEIRQLGNLGSTYGGLTGKSKRHFGHGASWYVSFLNVISNTVINPVAVERVDVGASESQNAVAKGDILLNGSSETPEEVALASAVLDELGGAYLNSFCFGFRPKSSADVDSFFLANLIRASTGRELISALAQGATRYNISKKAFLKLETPLPPLAEQRAIAAVLSDMDAELDALNDQIEKARRVKIGMMQDLLTGRVRIA